MFHALSAKDIHRIAKLQLNQVDKRLAEKGFAMVYDQAVLDLLAEVGYDPVFGARPLKRAVQQYIENPLADALLSSRFIPGDTIYMSVKNQKVVFQSEPEVG